ncbi:transaldolase [Halopolyspora algeriensis]|uniref:Transaldolase n=1 Tax=Halopolyspora algeriensis TaxID=1500506 RepID=A0A368VMZ1_9ACTN|nr:transaldolase [Halopolyspora algeriensis]RCW40402.1 transaldolase [Halopolyspora algeriensis]TQM53686.1 transaldolase [Halopolyspora algeriensis]
MTNNNNLRALSEAGVAVWLDDLSRQRINSGNLTELINDYELVGVTSNPTIFAKALSNAEDYDDQVRRLAERGASVDEATREITTTDIREAADLFRTVHQRTGGVDGRISLEVDPRLAHDTERTVAEAQELAKAVDRPNLFIKIPATAAGLPAITRTLAEGISVNVTLIFSVERYREVMDAFMAGLEQAQANGHDISRIMSVASFFVSRVDTEVDKRLNALGNEDLLGKAGIANARLAYAAYEEIFAGQRWKALEQAGAKVQRPLWASTGVKDPAYSDTSYVEELVAPNTVNTMPEATLYAAADHADIQGDKVSGTAASAQQVFDSLTEVGVDLDDVFAVLEREGVEKFEKSWDELLQTVSDQLGRAQ